MQDKTSSLQPLNVATKNHINKNRVSFRSCSKSGASIPQRSDILRHRARIETHKIYRTFRKDKYFCNAASHLITINMTSRKKSTNLYNVALFRKII